MARELKNRALRSQILHSTSPMSPDRACPMPSRQAEVGLSGLSLRKQKGVGKYRSRTTIPDAHTPTGRERDFGWSRAILGGIRYTTDLAIVDWTPAGFCKGGSRKEVGL